MSEILIRQAGPADIPAISCIEKASFESPKSEESIAAYVNEGGSLYFAIALENDECIGLAYMRMVAGEAQIYDIVVAPGARCRGTGKALLRHLIEKAIESSCDVMNLEVRDGNDAAQGLYKNTGFKEVGRRRSYYDSGEDAILMDLSLK